MSERWVKTHSRVTTTTTNTETHTDVPCWVNMAWVMSVHPSHIRKGGTCLVFGIGTNVGDDEATGYMDVPEPPEHFIPKTYAR
jgi:hypothetical protein